MLDQEPLAELSFLWSGDQSCAHLRHGEEGRLHYWFLTTIRYSSTTAICVVQNWSGTRRVTG